MCYAPTEREIYSPDKINSQFFRSEQKCRDSYISSKKFFLDESSNDWNCGKYNILILLLALIVAAGSLFFSRSFAAFMNTSVVDLYIHASFSYDAVETHFDNTAWTYVTDYMVFLWMMYGFVCLLSLGRKITGKSYRERRLRKISFTAAGLILSYAISVFCGGTAHYLCVSWEMLNTTLFRALWTTTVGLVTFAGGLIGLVGTELAHIVSTMSCETQNFKVIIVPRRFWLLYGIGLTYVVYSGGMSYKRPVCDIFIAGCTQIIPTVYSALVVLSQNWDESKISMPMPFGFGTKNRIEFFVGFFLNAPMMPAYSPLLDSGLTLGTINTILHFGLSLAWGMQFRSIHSFVSSNMVQLHKTA